MNRESLPARANTYNSTPKAANTLKMALFITVRVFCMRPIAMPTTQVAIMS